jgi:UDP-glucose 4-epimerase
MNWLVTGGAGYIGAHVVAAMREAGEPVVVLDDLSSGDPARIPGATLVEGSVLDQALLTRVIRDESITGVVHIAAKKQVEESVRRPLLYYRENVEGLRTLLEAGTENGVEALVFSSSAAVYGAPDVDLVTEETPTLPVNPYGTTKLIGERMISDVAAATGLRYANLRYFNVAGTAAPELTDRGAANLVPMVFQELAAGRPPRVFGDDYDTPDGTCVRDFVHVADIASAHVAAARGLADGRVSALTANIGRGDGVSVKEMVRLIRNATGTVDADWAEPQLLPRRPGDPPRVVASAHVIRETLGWEAQWGVQDMIASAWEGWSRLHGPVPVVPAS